MLLTIVPQIMCIHKSDKWQVVCVWGAGVGIFSGFFSPNLSFHSSGWQSHISRAATFLNAFPPPRPSSLYPISLHCFHFFCLLHFSTALWHFLWPLLMFWPTNLMMLNGVAVDCQSMRVQQAPLPFPQPQLIPLFWKGGVRKAQVVHQVLEMKENSICYLSCENFWDSIWHAYGILLKQIVAHTIVSIVLLGFRYIDCLLRLTIVLGQYRLF